MAEIDNNIQEQPMEAAKVLIALTKTRGKQKILVTSMEGYESGYTVDGIAIKDGEHELLIALNEQLLAYGGQSEDIPEGGKRSETSSMTDFDGEWRTDFIIAHYEFTSGAAVASKAFGWLPAGGEMALIYAHKAEIAALLEAVGGDPLSEDLPYWTSQMFSNEYPWHMSMVDGKFSMWMGQVDELCVRPVKSLAGYQEAEQ